MGAARPIGGAGLTGAAGPAGDVTQIGIRRASGADCDAIGRFLAGLSAKSLYLRFFTGAPPVTGAMLRRLAGEGGNVDVVVATEDGAIIGHAMAAETSGPAGARVAEIGVAVTDARQGRGIGTALTRELAARAGARGTRTVTMDVLAENRRVLAMIDRAWPAAHYKRSGPFVTVQASLNLPDDSPAQIKEERPGEPVPSC